MRFLFIDSMRSTTTRHRMSELTAVSENLASIALQFRSAGIACDESISLWPDNLADFNDHTIAALIEKSRCDFEALCFQHAQSLDFMCSVGIGPMMPAIAESGLPMLCYVTPHDVHTFELHPSLDRLLSIALAAARSVSVSESSDVSRLLEFVADRTDCKPIVLPSTSTQGAVDQPSTEAFAQWIRLACETLSPHIKPLL